MENKLNRVGLFLSQIVFSAITPLLLNPKVANKKITKSLVVLCFGKSYGSQYQTIIDSFQGRYDVAMESGLKNVKEALGESVSTVLDCGTGTGYVTKQASLFFPHATFFACDILPNMLKQATQYCKNIETDVFHLQADNFALPFADASFDLVLAQNTLACFSEFCRVCRPGGIMVYVDSSSGWITKKATRSVKKYNLFEEVNGQRVDMGFCITAKKAGMFTPTTFHFEGGTNLEKLANFLRCPID